MVDAFLPSASILSVCIFPSHKKHFYQILDYMHIFEIYSTFNNPTWKLIRIFCMCEESRTHLLPLMSVFYVGIHSFLSILSCLYRIIIPREKKKNYVIESIIATMLLNFSFITFTPRYELIMKLDIIHHDC